MHSCHKVIPGFTLNGITLYSDAWPNQLKACTASSLLETQSYSNLLMDFTMNRIWDTTFLARLNLLYYHIGCIISCLDSCIYL